MKQSDSGSTSGTAAPIIDDDDVVHVDLVQLVTVCAALADVPSVEAACVPYPKEYPPLGRGCGAMPASTCQGYQFNPQPWLACGSVQITSHESACPMEIASMLEPDEKVV